MKPRSKRSVVPPGSDVAGGAERAIPRLLAVLAIALQLRVAEARVEIERAVDLPRGEIALEEAVGAALDAALDEAGRRAGLADEVDGAAHGIAAEAERVRALEDLDVPGVQELERFEVAEAVGIAVGEAVDQHVDAAQVEVIAQARAADRELALVGGAEARPDQHAGHEVEHVLQVGRARVLDRLLRDQLDAARRAVDVLARLLLPCACARRAGRSTRRRRERAWEGRQELARRRWRPRRGRPLRR